MNSHQRRKERREAERFAATPEGAALIKAIDDLERFTLEAKDWIASRENISRKGLQPQDLCD